MRQVTLSRRPGDIQRRDVRAKRVVCGAGLLDRRFEIIGHGSQRRNRIVGGSHIPAQLLERLDVAIERGLALDDRRPESVDPSTRLVDIRGEDVRPLFHLRGGFFQAQDLGRQRARALDQSSVRRPRFGSPPAQLFGRLARLEQAALRDGQTVVGHTLRLIELCNRGPRLFLPSIERVAFFFGLPALARQLFTFLTEPCLLLRRVLQLGLAGHDGFLVFVVVGVQGGDGAGRVCNSAVQLRSLLGQTSESLAIRANAVAELLDLALGLEDAVSVRLRTT